LELVLYPDRWAEHLEMLVDSTDGCGDVDLVDLKHLL